MPDPIGPSCLSFVVQGPLSKGGPRRHSTAECVASIRRHFYGAQIVLSTWEAEAAAGLDCDVLVKSADPGGEKDVDGRPFNLNRQITSTLAGLKKSTRPFAVKIRSDTMMVSDAILRYHGGFDIETPLRLLNRRVLLPTVYSHSPAHKQARILFHPSDMFHFGLTADLLNLWDIPLQKFTAKTWGECPYVPEQYLWLAFLKKCQVKGAALSRYYEFSPRLLWISERAFIANFVVLSQEQLGISLSVPSHSDFITDTCYTHAEWRNAYRAYQDNLGAYARMAELLWIRKSGLPAWVRQNLVHWFMRVKVKLFGW